MTGARSRMEDLCSSNNRYSENFKAMIEFYDQNLWHQMSESLLDIMKKLGESETICSVFKKTTENSAEIESIFNNIILEINQKMNPWTLLNMCLIVISSMDSSKALLFIEDVKSKFSNDMCTLALNIVSLAQIIKTNQLEDAKRSLIEYKQKIDDIDSVNLCHILYYDVSTNYYKIVNDYTSYYHDALKYLGIVTMDKLAETYLVEIGINLCFAALCSNSIYSFGDLITHGILDIVRKNNYSWLVDVIIAINNGDIINFNAMDSSWKNNCVLNKHIDLIVTKAKINCLIELCFQENRFRKIINFQQISDIIGIPLNDVENLIMKALSLKMLKGSIDQIDQVFVVKWIISRIIDRSQQIKELLVRVESLNSKIGQVIKTVENESNFLL